MCDGVIAAIAPTDSEARFRALGATVLRGEARFVAPDALMVDGRRLTARRIVIAAGSRPPCRRSPAWIRYRYLTNTTLFGLPERPDHLLILGGGPIGLEMADAFAGLGCRVTVVEAATIAGKEDPELVAGLRNCLAGRGVSLLEGAKVTAVEPGPTLVLDDGRRIGGSHLLVAVGRRPNLAGARSRRRQRAGRPGRGSPPIAGLRSLTNRRVYASATSPIRRASARAPSPMSAPITPASSSAAPCSVCRRGSTMPRCRVSPTQGPNWRRSA